MKFKRVYHPYSEWEEVKYNMWGTVSDRDSKLLEAIEFTGNHILYGSYMRKVVEEWPISCENALTDYFLNRKAWLGHAACALAIQCPEDIIRLAWGKLTDEQQLLANKEAERAIQTWEYNYIKGKELYKDMGEPMLF